MSLSTPIEPAHAARAAAARAGVREARWTIGTERLVLAAASARGPDHPENEDAHSPIDRPTRLLVVADGVGSGALASLASRVLVEHLHRALDSGHGDGASESEAESEADAEAEAIRRAVLDADRVVQSRLAERTALPGAATLALCLRCESPAHWSLAWVGDCRVYHLPAPGAAQPAARALTRDDSYAGLGEPVPPGGSPDDPARMVGNGAVFKPNVAHAALGEDEGLLLCSDGLHRHVSVDQIGEAFARHGSLAAACDALLARARAQGSRDDVTVLALRRSTGPAREEPQAADPIGHADAGADSAGRPMQPARRAGGSGMVWLVLAMLLMAAGVALAWWLVRQRAEEGPEPPAELAPPSVRIER